MKRKEGTFLCQIKTQRHNAREHSVTADLCLLLNKPGYVKLKQ